MFCLIRTPRKIEADLRARTARALHELGISGITFTVSGQDVFLAGTARLAGEREKAVEAIAALRGVRRVADRIEIGAPLVRRDSLRAFRKWLGKQAVYFGAYRREISERGKTILRALADSLKAHPSVRVVVEGYSDSTGSPKLNRELSAQRARAAIGFLLNQGIVAKRLSAKGQGSANPRAPNSTEAERARNRRVEFKLLENR